MFYKLNEEPSAMPQEMLDHLKYREIYKVNRQHFSQKFTPLLDGHYDFVILAKPHPLVSIVYPLLIFAIIFVLRLSIYKIKRAPTGSVVTTRVMSKAKSAARKAAKARLLARRKRRAIDFRSTDISLGAALRSTNTDTRTADQSDTGGGAVIVLVEQITVKDEATVAGANSVEDTDTLMEPSSPDVTIYSSDSDSASEAHEAKSDVADGIEPAASMNVFTANGLDTDAEMEPVAGAGSDAGRTASEPGFSNNIESTVESIVDPIVESVVEVPEIRRTIKATGPGTGVEPSPFLSAFPKLDLTKGLQSAAPDSSDKEGILPALSTDSPATTVDAKPYPDRNHLPHVGIELGYSVALDPSIKMEKFPNLDAEAAPAILDTAVLLSPSLPGEPNAPVTSPRRRFVRPYVTVPKTEISIEAVLRLADMPEKSILEPKDEASISQGSNADMASISESDPSIVKVSGPAASKLKTSSTRTMENGEGTRQRSTMTTSLESSGTTIKEDEKMTKRRSTMAVKPEEGTKWPTFNVIPSNPNTPSWPKSPWTLERMHDRKSLQGRTSERGTHSPRTLSELRPQGFNLTPKSAPQSHSADTLPPLLTPFELRRASIFGQRPKISGDTPLTPAAASRRLSSTGFPATLRSVPLPQSPLGKTIPPSLPNHFDTRRPSILGPRPRISISILQSTQETVPVPPDKVPTASSNIRGDRTASPTVG